MKIASFNINGIKARLLLLREWLEREKPDVIGLQELKADNDKLEKNMFFKDYCNTLKFLDNEIFAMRTEGHICEILTMNKLEMKKNFEKSDR